MTSFVDTRAFSAFTFHVFRHRRQDLIVSLESQITPRPAASVSRKFSLAQLRACQVQCSGTCAALLLTFVFSCTKATRCSEFARFTLLPSLSLSLHLIYFLLRGLLPLTLDMHRKGTVCSHRLPYPTFCSAENNVKYNLTASVFLPRLLTYKVGTLKQIAAHLSFSFFDPLDRAAFLSYEEDVFSVQRDARLDSDFLRNKITN